MKGKSRFTVSGRQLLIIILMLSCCLALLTFTLDRLDRYEGKVIPEVTIEAGDNIDLSLFTDDIEYVKPAIDLSSLDNKTPAVYYVPFWCDNVRYTSVLTIVDTVPPEATVRDLKTDVNIAPDVMDYVVNCSDLNPITIDFEKEPDAKKGGENEGSVRFTDIAGNETILPVRLLVIDDFDPPVISGVEPIESYENDPIKYKENISVKDDMDPYPLLEVDNSKVDITTPGIYELTYRATDKTGNMSEVKTQVTIIAKPEGYVEPDLVYAEANKVLDTIVDNSMTDAEKGFAIYNWCKYNLHYIGTSDKSHWTAGAYEGFTTLRGDCFTYAVCAKALLDCAGIDNYLIERCDPVTTSHYWNMLCVEGEWYYMDCSSANTPMNAYLLTGDELWDLCYVHGFRYNYDHEGLPEPSTKSVQYRINYYAKTIDPA
ncbi:MAG: hypothetical protein K6F83_05130 [Clostridiales bacterium]|nr:hypothetical protein [Clostridiales bacterium]